MGSWAGGVHGSWTGQMMGYRGGGGGVHDILGGGPSPFFLFSENFTCSKKKIFGRRGGLGPLWDQRGFVPVYIYTHIFI